MELGAAGDLEWPLLTAIRDTVVGWRSDIHTPGRRGWISTCGRALEASRRSHYREEIWRSLSVAARLVEDGQREKERRQKSSSLDHADKLPPEPNQTDLPPCFCFSNCRFGERMACTASCVSALSADLLLCPGTFSEGSSRSTIWY